MCPLWTPYYDFILEGDVSSNSVILTTSLVVTCDSIYSLFQKSYEVF